MILKIIIARINTFTKYGSFLCLVQSMQSPNSKKVRCQKRLHVYLDLLCLSINLLQTHNLKRLEMLGYNTYNCGFESVTDQQTTGNVSLLRNRR